MVSLQMNTNDQCGDETAIRGSQSSRPRSKGETPSPATLSGTERELVNAIAGLLGGLDNVNGQRIVQPHDVGYARSVLWAMANAKGFCINCGHKNTLDGVVVHGASCVARMDLE